MNIEDTHRGIDLFVPNRKAAEEIVTKFEAGASVEDLRKEYREN